jgi:hypothetical protein
VVGTTSWNRLEMAQKYLQKAYLGIQGHAMGDELTRLIRAMQYSLNILLVQD